LMSPGMPNTASEISDKIGHIMNYGDGWYGGVYVGAMYTLAFLSDDIEFVVTEALKTIPEQSLFYQCMNDVIGWHREFPDDSDCNPASAGGILGAIIGYDRIPDYWMKNLKEVEDMNFAYTDISLNKTYRMSFNQALQVIERGGGKVDGSNPSRYAMKKHLKVIIR